MNISSEFLRTRYANFQPRVPGMIVENTPFLRTPTWAPVHLSPQAQNQVEKPSRSGPQTLQLFGGDRKTAIGTLIASGVKGENPNLGFFKNVFRKIFGGTKTRTKRISASQTIATKVKVRNFNLKELRLSTKDGATTRHIDFSTRTPGGGTAQVKDIGTVIAKGTPTRIFEQSVQYPSRGQRGKVVNDYFDPKTGRPFLRTTEVAERIEVDKFGTAKSRKNRRTHRQIEVLGKDGKANRRYTFDYARKSVRLENLNPAGEVVNSYALSRKTDFFDTVSRLSRSAPSAKLAAAKALLYGGGGGGGRRGARVHVAHH